jgi:uncharacterized membrane protein
MKYKTLIITTILTTSFISCTNDSESDLLNPTTATVISYTNFTKSVITNNCTSCHADTPINGASISLTTYNNVKDAIQNSGLIDRISRTQGAPGMMPNGGARLPQNTIDKIIQWRDEGFLE